MALVDHAQEWLTKVAADCAAQEQPFACASRPADPVQTLYWGAHRFGPDTLASMHAEARSAFKRYAADPSDLAEALDIAEPALAARVHRRVAQKLDREPIEDIRLDFEDGYGKREDPEEDAHADACGRAVLAAHVAGTLPRRYGIRIKALTAELGTRSLRTLERFVLAAGGREMPPGFVVTLPKVTVVAQVEAITDLLGALETDVGLPPGSIGLEFMLEVPQAVFDGQGRLLLPRLLAAGGERLLGIHLGVYDYTAAHEIVALHQAMDHPACDLIRGLMRMAYSGSGRTLSAGSTNVLPREPHPIAATQAHVEENRAAVHGGWRLAHDQIRHTLVRGYYHGWDLDPLQLPARYAACYRFYLEGHAAAAGRLSSYIAQATAATEGAGVLDDVATGQALLNIFVRGRACGAFDAQEVAAAGVSDADLDDGSFARLLARRSAAGGA
ncbi:MAG: DUF6986 family protein [Nannocystales bacterium]